MSFIAYAQNNEDVVLFRALEGVVNGFYIDVGANDPVADSVTKAFYDRGWRGINVEPLERHWGDLERDRPEDTNLRCVAGPFDGNVDIWEPAVRGWTTASPKVVEEHKASGVSGVTHSVKMLTLAAICQQHVTGEIHFLKIDVEGFEKDVLEGMDFQSFRPWIVVVEAFDPITKMENFDEWEPLLTSQAYSFAYGDGLNRFYVANEHPELKERMKYPPNVFDDFVRIAQVVQTKRADEAEKGVAQKLEHTAALEKQVSDRVAEKSQLEAEMSHLVAEKSHLEAQLGDVQKKYSKLKGDISARDAAFEHQNSQLLELDDVHANALAELNCEKERVAEFSAKAHEWWSRALALDSELMRVKGSWSWKATYPLRVLLGVIRHPVPTLKQFVNNSIRWSLRFFSKPMSMLMRRVLGNRNFSERLNYWLLKNYPALHAHLRAIAIQNGAMVEVERPKFTHSTMNPTSQDGWFDLGLLGVFPRYPTLPEGLAFSGDDSGEPRWIRFTGHLEGHYSLAIVNRNIVSALDALTPGRVQFVPFHGKPYEKIPTLPNEQERSLGPALRRQIPDSVGDHTVSITHHYPMIGDELPSGLKLCIFFWEETSVPIETVAQLNSNFDGVVVAAESVKVALVNSGCQIPAVVLPIGIDHLIAQDTKPVQSVKPETDAPFRFLHVSSAFHRKGVDVLLDAFLDAFTGDDVVELYIKTFPNPHNQVAELLRAYSEKHKRPARVVIDEQPLDEAGMIDLYRTAHAAVLPTRGEGFNLPAAEALAMGIPVITTGYSAQIDFCTLSTAHLVGFQFAASESHVRADDACWVNPSKADLVRQFRRVRERVLADDPEIRSMRESASKYVRNIYSWENAARSVTGFSEWLMAQKNAPRSLESIALLTPWAAKCGIAEYSEKLFKNIVELDDISTKIFADTRTKKPDANVFVTWKVGDTASIIRTLERLQEQNVDAIFVQHQPSLYELSEAVCEQLSALRTRERGVYLELHSTQPLLTDFRLTPRAVRCLAQLDRIVVHKVEDLNNLLSLGLWRNVVLLKHGVVQPLPEPDVAKVRNAHNIPFDAVVLGCFGFALPHKGLDAVVGAISLLGTELERPVHMLAVCSALDDRSAHVIKSCKAQAERLGVSNQITWITDYRPIKECQELLSSVDYMVFPYRDTQESASGAVTIGLSTLKPVLVSPLSIFSDVSDVTLEMSGPNSSDICMKVVEWESASEETKTLLLEKQREWLRVRDWTSVSQRLLSMASVLRREALMQKKSQESRLLHFPQTNVKPSRRLFVDISELYVRDAKTGIQRVVRNILSELEKNPLPGYSVQPVYGVKGKGFFHASASDFPFNAIEGAPIFPGVDDIFLGLDLAAHLFPEAEEDLASFKRAGTKIFYVVYDIIPLRYKEYAFPGIECAFENWLIGLNRYADGVLCISKAVADDVESWLIEHGGKREGLALGYFHLGADFQDEQVMQSDVASGWSVPTQLQDAPIFLMVGTLEPRKGHAQILRVFEHLWSEGVHANLVIVGKAGWNVEALISALKESKHFNQSLFWFESLDDAALNQLYSSATCLIAASYAEGFGLPLIEAAQKGLNIIARDIPVFREVGEGYVSYFDGERDDAIRAFMYEWMQLFASEKVISSRGMKWKTWGESADDLKQFLCASNHDVSMGKSMEKISENIFC
ncbi:FkbM family methyltransferase [Diaphorobacter sp. HDW4B]|uniref:FkbM family methyltransferase n=1 Tax=Diaphorobacter sp. HDW4B TaxID=2714925 RepID=UPI0014097037|nr:FkbM family methyltransferase [Diaphorobacter sp. HDW4B]QIL70097.1 FkbM family methyltransferase [Diaphorobacter sp. HDW4B]